MEFFGINIKNRAPARQKKKNKIMNTNTMELNLETMETVNGGIELDESTKFQINLEIRINKQDAIRKLVNSLSNKRVAPEDPKLEQDIYVQTGFIWE